jgi:hypothetical protein
VALLAANQPPYVACARRRVLFGRSRLEPTAAAPIHEDDARARVVHHERVTIDLLFMSDYSADPVWDPPIECMVNLDELPLTDDTRAAIRGWANRWEDTAWPGMDVDAAEEGVIPGPVEPVPTDLAEAIERDGRALCQRLRDELGTGWRVGWISFENDERRVQWEPDGPANPG